MNLIERLKKLFSDKKDGDYHCYHLYGRNTDDEGKSWVVWCARLDFDSLYTTGYDLNGREIFKIKAYYPEFWLWNTETNEPVATNPYEYDKLMNK